MAIYSASRPSLPVTGGSLSSSTAVTKSLQFLGERAHVTLEEEIERFVGADAVFRAYFYVGGFLIESCRAALRAEYLDALVIAICRFAAVVL